MKRLFKTLIVFLGSYSAIAQSVIEGTNPSTASNDYAIKGTISSTNPGGFSSAIRGQNNGTSGLGIGVYGSQNGSGWGVHGVTPSGIGVYGNATSSGYGLYGNSSSGTGIFGISTNGRAAEFIISNSVNANTSLAATTSGTGQVAAFTNTNSTNLNNVVDISSSGRGKGLSISLTNTSNSSNGVSVVHAGIGNGLSIQLSNGSGRGIEVSHTGNGPGVFASTSGGNAIWGISGSISAAGVIGDNFLGEAVVGRNRGVNNIGAVVGRNDSTGIGVRGFNTKTGVGVLGQSGISGGTGVGGRFENVNAANTNDVLQVLSNSTGNLMVLKKSGSNVARIDATGRGYFNGGTVSGGADLAEAFDVEGDKQTYEPGDVMVISTINDRTLTRSDDAYSGLVVGVYATKPGILLTEDLIDGMVEDKIPLGVVGVIPTKVCMEGGEIKRGDFLVTSSLTGVAMKADMSRIKIGQLIGKALQGYNEEGVGKIKVLVNVR